MRRTSRIRATPARHALTELNALARNAAAGHDIDPARLAASRTTRAWPPTCGPIHQQRRRTRGQDGKAATKNLRPHAHPHRRRHFLTIRSYLTTTAKHDIGILEALTRLAEDQPWLPQAPE